MSNRDVPQLSVAAVKDFVEATKLIESDTRAAVTAMVATSPAAVIFLLREVQAAYEALDVVAFGFSFDTNFSERRRLYAQMEEDIREALNRGKAKHDDV